MSAQFETLELKAMEKNSDPLKLLDNLAEPFVVLAEKLESVRANGTNHKDWIALTDTNMYCWRFIVNYLPRHFHSRVSPSSKAMLEMIADFMIRAAKAMRYSPDDNLLKQMIQMNVNMYDQIMAIADEFEAKKKIA